MIATGNASQRHAVSRYLQARGLTTVVADSSDFALTLLNDGNFEMVVADLPGSDSDGIALMCAVRKLTRGLPILLLDPSDENCVFLSIDRAFGFQEARDESDTELSSRFEALSSRERQIVDLVVAGRSSKTIALELSISHRTVENHRARIKSKLGINNVAELIALALRAAPAGRQIAAGAGG